MFEASLAHKLIHWKVFLVYDTTICVPNCIHPFFLRYQDGLVLINVIVVQLSQCSFCGTDCYT